MPRKQVGDPPPLIYTVHQHLIGADSQSIDKRLENLVAKAAAMNFTRVALDFVPAAGDADAFIALCEAHGLGAIVTLQTEAVDPGRLGDSIAHLFDAGWAAIRFEAAESVSETLWHNILSTSRSRHPEGRTILNTAGIAFPTALNLARTGFDAVIDSGAWWNGKTAWYPEQRNAFAPHAVPISFVEDAEYGRFSARLPGYTPEALADALVARYLWILGLSCGVGVSMGFETAGNAAPPIDEVSGADGKVDMGGTAVDLSRTLAAINAAAQGNTVLATPGRIDLLPSANVNRVGVLRHCADEMQGRKSTQRALLVAGDSGTLQQGLSSDEWPDELVEAAMFAGDGHFQNFEEVTPAGSQEFSGHAGPDSSAAFARLHRTRWLQATYLQPKSTPIPKRSLLAELNKLASKRIAIEQVQPGVDHGRFPVKRVVGDYLNIGADIFCDGHDKIAAAVIVTSESGQIQSETPMQFVENDRWQARVRLAQQGNCQYDVLAWRDLIGSWQDEVTKKQRAGLDTSLECRELASMVESWCEKAPSDSRERLQALIDCLNDDSITAGSRVDAALAPASMALLRQVVPRDSLTQSEYSIPVWIERPRASFGAWYEMFPRSAADDEQRHGTFDDVIDRLPYIQKLGFDVLYFPPIHPIGVSNRKGKNNSLTAEPDDPGSPYAIGAESGGHQAIHAELGTFDDFARLIAAAKKQGMEVALDFAIQCSPDHPWIREHPEWFDWRPDGSLKFAENPPKKYEDISNVSFYSNGAVTPLWLALRDVVIFWIKHGVSIFRVDNPHTKPYPFWEWLIGTVRRVYPDTVFLAEAFTRPKVMARLAKLGFSQSYSYFTWRNEKHELVDYMTELTQTNLVEFMRPNFFVNTPDINPVYLQSSGPPGFVVRATLAATLSTSWGMLAGYELCEAAAIAGKEEYLDSEKYQLRSRNWDADHSIADQIAGLNRIRRTHPALWQFRNLQFHQAWNQNILVYSKWNDAVDSVILVAVNLDPHHAHECEFEVPMWRFGLADDQTLYIDDLIGGHHQVWTGKVQRLRLDPDVNPVGIWHLDRTPNLSD